MRMSVEDVITSLEQAKQKLTAAKRNGLAAVQTIGKARELVGAALGRGARQSPLIVRMAAKERNALAQVRRIDDLIARVEASIARAREVGRGGEVGRDGPAADGRSGAP
jgi:hypothetical protein